MECGRGAESTRGYMRGKLPCRTGGFVDNKGQAFAGFRLFIGAIMALLILVIIIGGITAVEEIKYRVSAERLFSSAENAVQSPNLDLVVAEKLSLKAGSAYSSAAFSEAMGIPAECITVKAAELQSLQMSDSTVYISKNLVVDVYFVCEIEQCGDSEISCTVSFGEKP